MAGQRDRSLLPLSAVPLLFSVQQACEGVGGIGIGHENAELTHASALAYLFFAQLFWLIWIPFSAAILEPRKKVKLLLRLVALPGLTGGLAFYLPILLSPEVLVVTVVHHSIRYDVAQSSALDVIPQLVWHFSYLVVVSAPLFLVANKKKGLIAFGTALAVSAAISHAFFWYPFASVWCLFAAILPLVLVYAIHQLPLLTKRKWVACPIEPTRIRQQLTADLRNGSSGCATRGPHITTECIFRRHESRKQHDSWRILHELDHNHQWSGREGNDL